MSRHLPSVIVALVTLGCPLARAADDAPTGPDGWHGYAARPEIAPRFWVEQPGDRLAMAGRGDDALDGRWLRRVPVTAGKYYAFSAEYRDRNVPTPERSVLARVLWFDAAGKQIGTAEYPATAPFLRIDGSAIVTSA